MMVAIPPQTKFVHSCFALLSNTGSKGNGSKPHKQTWLDSFQVDSSSESQPVREIGSTEV
jgi:hypothetical protein